MIKTFSICLLSYLLFLPKMALSYEDDCVGFCDTPDYSIPNIYRGKTIQFIEGSKQHYNQESWRDMMLGRNFTDAIRQPHKITCTDVLYHANNDPPLKRQFELFVGYDRAYPRGVGVFTVQNYQSPQQAVVKSGYQYFLPRQHNGERYYEFICGLKVEQSKSHYNSEMKVWDYSCLDRYGDTFFTLKQFNVQDKVTADVVDLNKLEAVIELLYPFNGESYNDGKFKPQFFEECTMEIWPLKEIVKTYQYYSEMRN